MISLKIILKLLIKTHILVVTWFDNRNLVAALVVDDQTFIILDCFVCCINVGFKNTTNEQIQYLWEKKSSVTVYDKT